MMLKSNIIVFFLVTSATLVVTGALLVVTMFAIRNKCLTTSNKEAAHNRQLRSAKYISEFLLLRLDK